MVLAASLCNQYVSNTGCITSLSQIRLLSGMFWTAGRQFINLIDDLYSNEDLTRFQYLSSKLLWWKGVRPLSDKYNCYDGDRCFIGFTYDGGWKSNHSSIAYKPQYQERLGHAFRRVSLPGHPVEFTYTYHGPLTVQLMFNQLVSVKKINSALFSDPTVDSESLFDDKVPIGIVTIVKETLPTWRDD